MKTFNEIVKQEVFYSDDFFFNKHVIVEKFEGIYFTYYELLMGKMEPLLPCIGANDPFVLKQREKYKKAWDKYKDFNILFAWRFEHMEGYGSDPVHILFEQNGKLYEVNAIDSIAQGLQGQWQPKEVNLDELEHRLLFGTFGEEEGFKEELCAFLGVPFKKNSAA